MCICGCISQERTLWQSRKGHSSDWSVGEMDLHLIQVPLTDLFAVVSLLPLKGSWRTR